MAVRKWKHYILLLIYHFHSSCATDYRIDVTTVNNREAGPNSVTYITVKGTLGQLEKMKLPTGVQEARLDTLAIDRALDIGLVCRIDLISGSNDSWFVGTVFVRINDQDRRTQLFMFNQWLTDLSIINRYFKVHGGWRHWTPWGSCSSACNKKGIQARNRTCDHPVLGCGGEPCSGDSLETRSCVNSTCGDTPRPRETTETHNLLPWILGLAGCCAVIVLLIILLIIVCCLYRRQKIKRQKAEQSPYAIGTHTRVSPNEISFISNSNPLYSGRIATTLAERPSSTYGSLSAVDGDSGIMVKGRENDEAKFNEQNNCVDYVYYTYNSGGKGKDKNGNAPMFVPCGKRPVRPAKWEVNDMYETNVTVL